ncbi:MAG TPA: hypothetical protein VGM32_23015 [Rhodopila sp.]|jgi:hypothetical protein
MVFLADHATPIWAVLSASASGIGAWLLSLRNISATVERSRMAMSAEMLNAEAAERTAFRAALMTEVSEMRQIIKAAEIEKESLRQRLNAADAQILVLKASNEIMERWIAFFNERGMGLDIKLPTDPPTARSA